MFDQEWSKLHWNANLNIELFHACCIKHAFPAHMHDYYVICLIEQGFQSFSHRGSKYVTPPGGLIMLNPGDDHTGEPADQAGFEYRAIYPTVAHMQEAVFELTGRHQDSPYFINVRVDNQILAKCVRNLYVSLMYDANPLEAESLFIHTLTSIVTKTADFRYSAIAVGRERDAVSKARQYIHSNWSQKITLSELAKYAGLSRYYFLRVFCTEAGMPPHSYQDSVKMSHAKRLLKQGLSLKAVATETGFSDQSHFTNRFKRVVGVTPGFYVKEHLS
ncbi:MAG TPA: AraC family transcriptional regulator [Negativicutes bacterium]|jgi:AraC-like DNA-binding protein